MERCATDQPRCEPPLLTTHCHTQSSCHGSIRVSNESGNSAAGLWPTDGHPTEQVSIGADEYNASLADDYNNFVNEMVSPLRKPFHGHRPSLKHGFTTRVERLYRAREWQDDSAMGHPRTVQSDVCQQKHHDTALVSLSAACQPDVSLLALTSGTFKGFRRR